MTWQAMVKIYNKLGIQVIFKDKKQIHYFQKTVCQQVFFLIALYRCIKEGVRHAKLIFKYTRIIILLFDSYYFVRVRR